MMWWKNGANMRRLIVDFVLGHISRLRPGAHLPSPQAVMLSENWLASPLNIDSLELVDCATAFAQMLHIADSGLEDFLLAKPSVNGWKEIATASLENFHHFISFSSSGSTSPPVVTTIPLAHIQQEVDFIAQHLLTGNSAVRRIWTLIPAQHIYGFIFTMALPSRLINRPEVIDGRQRLPVSLEKTLQDGDMIVSIPDFWQHWLSSGLRLPRSVTIVMAGAPCAPKILAALLAQNADTIEIYGATETGGIGYRKKPNEPFSLFPYWQIVNDSIRNHLHSAKIPDKLHWLDKKHFIVQGRKDGQIQIAGINVSLEAIASEIKQHAAIHESVVRFDGKRLKAYIVPNEDSQLNSSMLIDELFSWLSTRLPSTQIPKHFTLGSKLPRNEMGKLCDWD